MKNLRQITFKNTIVDLLDVFLEPRQLGHSTFLHAKIFCRSSVVWPSDVIPLKGNHSNTACDNKHRSHNKPAHFCFIGSYSTVEKFYYSQLLTAAVSFEIHVFHNELRFVLSHLWNFFLSAATQKKVYNLHHGAKDNNKTLFLWRWDQIRVPGNVLLNRCPPSLLD